MLDIFAKKMSRLLQRYGIFVIKLYSWGIQNYIPEKYRTKEFYKEIADDSILKNKLKPFIDNGKHIFEYIQMIEQIVEEGINKKEIIDGDKNVIASGIFGFTCSSLIYKMRNDNEINVMELYSEIEKSFIRKLKK